MANVLNITENNLSVKQWIASHCYVLQDTKLSICDKQSSRVANRESQHLANQGSNLIRVTIS